MLRWFLPYRKLSQPYINIHHLPLGLPSHAGNRSALSRVPCAIQYVLMSYLFFTCYQQCILSILISQFLLLPHKCKINLIFKKRTQVFHHINQYIKQTIGHLKNCKKNAHDKIQQPFRVFKLAIKNREQYGDFFKKLEIQLPYDPAIPLLGIHTGESRSERDTCIPMFIAALFIIARTCKQPRGPSADEQIRKLWYIYTVEYYSAIKKNSFEAVLMRWMKLEPIIQSEVSQKDKDHYNILTHIYGIQKDVNDNSICRTEKETQIYRTVIQTLWEKARVGCSERTALKQVYYQG